MSSKLTQISIALLLSAVVAPSVFATTIIISPEEEKAMRTATPTTVKRIAQDAVSTATAAGVVATLDAYEQRLGGSEEEIKSKIGVGGFTSILEDLSTVAQQANAGGLVTQTVQAAIAANVGADIAVTARIGAAPVTGTVLGDLDQQIDRIANGNVVMKTAIDTTVGLFGATAVPLADLNAELTAERTALLAWINLSANNLTAAHAYAPVVPADALIFDGGNNNDPITAANPLNTIHKLLLFARGAINL
jgi:hypothetical protein